MKISNFQFKTPLWLYRSADASKLAPKGKDPLYVVGETFRVSFKVKGYMAGDLKEAVVPKGMLTDLASVPRVARSVAGRVGRHLEASIVHDYLYGRRSPTNREYADAVFNAGMKASGVPRFRRWLIYRAVRAFGGKAWRHGRNQYVKITD